MYRYQNIPGHFLMKQAFKQVETSVFDWFTMPNIIDVSEITMQTGKRRMSTQLIVVHHDDAVGSEIYAPVFEITVEHVQRQLVTFAYHYYISKSGKVYQMHPFDALTHHTENFNQQAVSVCVNGRYSNESIPEAQYKALINLLVYLQNQAPYAHIKGHGELAATDCPGANINMDIVRKNVTNYKPLKNLISNE
jgi:N-acetylmuramoyl-L-alanine amidase